MNEQEFIKRMKEDVLNTKNDINFDMELNKLREWDSLSFVNFIAMAKELGFTQVNRDRVKDAITLHDLFNLLK